MEGSPIIRDGGRARITIDETIRRDLYLNGLFVNMVCNREQWLFDLCS